MRDSGRTGEEDVIQAWRERGEMRDEGTREEVGKREERKEKRETKGNDKFN